MMKQKQRFLVLLLAAAFLCGCGGGEKKPVKSKAKAKPASTAPAMPAGAGMPQPDSGGSPDAEEEAPPPASKRPGSKTPSAAPSTPEAVEETPETVAQGGLPFAAPEFFAAVRVRPAEFLEAPLVKKAVELVLPPPEGSGVLGAALEPRQRETAVGIARALEPWKGIEELWFFAYEVKPGPAPKIALAAMVKAKAPITARDFAAQWGRERSPKEEIVDGKKFLILPNSYEDEIDPFDPPIPGKQYVRFHPGAPPQRHPVAIYQLDSRTILQGETKLLQRTITGNAKPSPLSTLVEQRKLDAPFMIFWTPGPFKPLLAKAKARLEAGTLAAPYSKLPEFLARLESAVLKFSLKGPELLSLDVALDDEAAGARLKETLDEVWTEGKMLVGMGIQQAKGLLGPTTQAAVQELREKVSVAASAKGAVVSFGLPTTVEAAMDEAAAGFHSTMQALAERDRPKKELGRIAEAISRYETAHRRFPSDVVARSGKVGLSWRVQILPQLGRKDLYDKFNQDEPWDSATNKPLVDQMPPEFEVPGAGAGRTSIFVFKGKGTMMWRPGDGGVAGMVRDGLGATIMLARAKPERAVPWTQPTDLDYDPAKMEALVQALPEKDVLIALFDTSVEVLTERPTAERLDKWVGPNNF